MGRPRSFDEAKALDAAAECFWSRGFEGTSVRDLACRMGIAGPSLYNAYGGKLSLYAVALEHYCNKSMRERIARIDSSASGIPAIEAFFQDVIAKSLQDRARKGCFLVNAALEAGPHDPGLREAINGYLKEITAFFQRQIERAQADGHTPPALDPGLYAVHLLAVLMGIRVLARCCADRPSLEAAAGPALKRLRVSNLKIKDP